MSLNIKENTISTEMSRRGDSKWVPNVMYNMGNKSLCHNANSEGRDERAHPGILIRIVSVRRHIQKKKKQKKKKPR